MPPTDSPISKELRKRGLIPLPRLWVKSEYMDKIHEIAAESTDDVNEVRRLYREGYFGNTSNQQKPAVELTAEQQKDLAWAQYEAGLRDN